MRLEKHEKNHVTEKSRYVTVTQDPFHLIILPLRTLETRNQIIEDTSPRKTFT